MLKSDTVLAETNASTAPVIVIPEDNTNWTGPPQPGPNMPIQDVVKSLIDFLASR